VLDLTTRSVVAIDRSRRVDYTLQCERLKALAEQWQPIQIIAEQNSIGQPIIEQLSRDGLPIQPFTTTNASKAQAIEALALAFERGDIRVLNDAVLVGELVAYQAERLPSGLLRYGAPSGQHDDTVMALAVAWSAVSMQHRLIYPIPDARIVVQDFTIPDHWPRAYGLDIRWNTVAVIWGARNPQTDVLPLQ
jgi:Terminase RNaseH-like domain